MYMCSAYNELCDRTKMNVLFACVTLVRHFHSSNFFNNLRVISFGPYMNGKTSRALRRGRRQEPRDLRNTSTTKAFIEAAL